MSFSAPKPPDPVATAQAQTQYNTQAAKTQQGLNSYNQSNPFGSVNYVADANSPSGYSIDTSLSAPQQALLNTQNQNKDISGRNATALFGTAGELAHNTAGMYSGAPNIQAFDPTSLVSQLNSWQQKYQQPLFNQQASNLEAQLRNQGLTPGSEAYNNAKNLLARNQGDVTNQFMTNNIGTGLQAQNQKFGQDVTNYQLPLQTEQALLSNAGAEAGYGSPTAPQFQQAPTTQIQPANYQGAVQSNYQGQVDNYNNTWNNIGKLGTAAVSLGMAPLTGGTSLAGMFASGLSGGWGGGGPITYGTANGPTAFYNR